MTGQNKSSSWVVPFVLLFGFSVWGQESPTPAKPESLPAKTPEIITSMTLESFQRIVQGMGFDCTRDKDEKGNLENYFIFRAEGYKVGAQLPTNEFIWLYNQFTDGTTLEAVNEWNQNNRFSRASWNKTGKSVLLDTEIILRGGVTRENIETQVKEFRDSVGKWARFVIDHPKPDPKPATPAAQ